MSALPDHSRQRSSFQKRSDVARKVRGGIKLAGFLTDSSQAKDIGGLDLAHQFQALWESAIAPEALAAGLEYAKSGQIVDLEIRAGVVSAHVQGTLPKPYAVELHMPVLTQEQWERAIKIMSGEAVYVAKLLAGEVPAAIHERLQQGGLNLLPTSVDALSAKCTCAAANSPATAARCKHIACVVYVAAERLSKAPLVAFTMLGMTSDALLEQLRHERASRRDSLGAKSSDVFLLDDSLQAPPLEACIDDFWRSPLRGEDWDQLQDPLTRHYAPHALLRRLGPSPMSGRFPLVGLLASVYDTVAAAAKQMRKSRQANEPATDKDPTN